MKLASLIAESLVGRLYFARRKQQKVQRRLWHSLPEQPNRNATDGLRVDGNVEEDSVGDLRLTALAFGRLGLCIRLLRTGVLCKNGWEGEDGEEEES